MTKWLTDLVGTPSMEPSIPLPVAFAQTTGLREVDVRFLCALWNEDHAGIKLALDAGANINARFTYSMNGAPHEAFSALLFSASRPSFTLTQFLVDRGADMFARDSTCKLFPISWAAQLGATNLDRRTEYKAIYDILKFAMVQGLPDFPIPATADTFW
eukprot:NODE_9857_length_622_cov_79.392786_g9589_i0.p1 GENE.NODE_9857_length_622_cov_79.392786_g9589_i0~~NODE_9857_length_622_cov_79.392786_g9589_i0.p1  ORF type:complete len:177 (+),score=12.55 NODE_9857_length_622_cov_79.392786_g9589_i0:59-532(+)